MNRRVPATQRKTLSSPVGRPSRGWPNSDFLSLFLHFLWLIVVAAGAAAVVVIQAHIQAVIQVEGMHLIQAAIQVEGMHLIQAAIQVEGIYLIQAAGTAVITAAAIIANIAVGAEASTITVIIAPIDTAAIVADTAAAS
jgi:hypothetical protein